MLSAAHCHTDKSACVCFDGVAVPMHGLHGIDYLCAPRTCKIIAFVTLGTVDADPAKWTHINQSDNFN